MNTVTESVSLTKKWRQDILFLTLVFSILFGSFLGSRPLTVPDEGRYAEIPREMVTSGDYVTPRVNGVKYFEKPPLFYWMQAASFKALGINEWSIRLPNGLMGLLGVLLVYGTGRKLYSRRAGLLAALTMGTFGLYMGMARMVTLDMTLATLISGTFCCFILGNLYPAGTLRDRFMWGMYFCAALATLTKGLVGIIFPGMVIFSWLLMTRNWRELKTYCLPTGFLLLAAITVPWHILVQLKNPEFFKYYVIDQQFLRYITDSEGRHQPFWFLPLALLGGLFPWTGFIFPAIWDARSTQWRVPHDTVIGTTLETSTHLFLMLWAGLVFLFFWLSNSQLVPYVLPVYPPLALLLGRYLDRAITQPLCKGPRAGLAVAGLLTTVLITLVWSRIDFTQLSQGITLGCLGLLLILPLLVYWRSTLLHTLISLGLTSSLFLLSLNFSYPPTDTRSVKALAIALKPLLKDTDTVYSYQDHYQDLPVYLGRRVVMVEFYGELWFGLEHTKHNGIWVRNSDFWPRWSEAKRQFMIMSLNEYKAAKDLHKGPLYEIDRTRVNILVSNFPNET